MSPGRKTAIKRFPSARLPPILPSRLSFSFIRRQSSRSHDESIQPTMVPPEPPQVPPPSHHQNSTRHPHHTTFPRHPLANSPRIYLHTPLCEIDGDEAVVRAYRRRMSLPSVSPTRYCPPKSAPAAVGSAAPSSTRVSLRSAGTDSFALRGRPEQAARR